MKKGLSVKTIVAIGIGAAVFVVLGRFAAIPLWIPNTNVEVTYPFLALMSVIFGPVAGGLIGLIGHALKDLLMYGSIWWSWVIVSGFVGVGLAYVLENLTLNLASSVQKKSLHSIYIKLVRKSSGGVY